MVNNAVIKIINNVDLLINYLKENKANEDLLPTILKIKIISNNLLTEKEKIENIISDVKLGDIFNLYYLIDNPIELLEDGLIAQNPSIKSIKIRNDISDEDKANRIKYISTNFNNLIKEGNNLTDIINLVNVPLTDPPNTFYYSSLDLPYCNKTLYLRAGKDAIIYFRLDNEAPWLLWEGNNHCYNILKQERFKPASKWYVNQELNLIDQYINIFYSACLIYFKNVE